MCVVSMVMDHYREKWEPLLPQTPWPLAPNIPDPYRQADPDEVRKALEQFGPKQPAITKEEVEEFRRLLERAREYDKRNQEPDCELDEKRQAIKDIAKQLGVEISFL